MADEIKDFEVEVLTGEKTPVSLGNFVREGFGVNIPLLNKIPIGTRLSSTRVNVGTTSKARAMSIAKQFVYKKEQGIPDKVDGVPTTLNTKEVDRTGLN